MSKKEAKLKKAEKVAKKEINPENYFVLGNGGVIKSIEEFGSTLDHLSDDEFRYHVNDTKNDFANWIRDVFAETELAEKLFATKDKKDTQIIVLKYLLNSKR
jgi:hypothetical protein